jgi:hypothetical protein
MRDLDPLERAALVRRHRVALQLVADASQRERWQLPGAVVAPSNELASAFASLVTDSEHSLGRDTA